MNPINNDYWGSSSGAAGRRRLSAPAPSDSLRRCPGEERRIVVHASVLRRGVQALAQHWRAARDASQHLCSSRGLRLAVHLKQAASSLFRLVDKSIDAHLIAVCSSYSRLRTQLRRIPAEASHESGQRSLTAPLVPKIDPSLGRVPCDDLRRS